MRTLISKAAVVMWMLMLTTAAMASRDDLGKAKAGNSYARHDNAAAMSAHHRHRTAGNVRRIRVYGQPDGGGWSFPGRFFPPDYGYCYDAKYGYYAFGACNFIGH
jgi:hypothetical protein